MSTEPSAEGTRGVQAPQGMVRVIVNLPEAQVEEIKQISAETGSSRTQIVRDAIATLLFLRRELAQGGRVLLERNGERRELLFSWARETSPVS